MRFGLKDPFNKCLSVKQSQTSVLLLRPFALLAATFAKKRNVMNANNKMNRRDFIKTSVAAGGALLASTAIPGQAMNLLQEQKNDNKFAADDLF